jgi:hypothetical protein
MNYNDPLFRWLMHGQRGLSSEAMVAYITGTGGSADHPYDPSDLGRCRLLVEQVPIIRMNLKRMADCSPVWAQIIAHWDELCSLMDEEAPEWRRGVGGAPMCYALLRQCREAQP